MTSANEPSGDRMQAALIAAAEARGATRVAIKPLEWRAIERARSNEDPSTEETGDYEATAPVGYYFIEMAFGTDSYVWTVYFCGEDVIVSTDDPDKAKAAAQADYEARIRSALVEVPDGGELRRASSRISELERALIPFLNGGVPLAGMTREEFEYVRRARVVLEKAFHLAEEPAGEERERAIRECGDAVKKLNIIKKALESLLPKGGE